MITYPDAVQALLSRIVEGFRHILADNLFGIYLHGSLTMGCFNPRTSDVDFLVVVETPLTASDRKTLAAFSLDLEKDAPPKGIEYSIVLQQDARHFTHPTPFEFHYSRDWHDRFVAGEFDFVYPRVDADLAAHFVITQARGRALYGLPIAEVFGEVPERDYWASISADAADILDNLTANPVYSVLNLCRVIAYKQDKLIASKVEGAAWALQHVDPQYHPLIEQALDAYQSPVAKLVQWDEDELTRFGAYAKTLLFG